MAQPIQHTLLDPTIHLAVEADGVARPARYQTTYDDGTTGETFHQLYRDGGVVRSVLLADWPAEQQALAARDADRAKHEAMNTGLRTAAERHTGKQAAQLTFPELRDFLLLLMDREGLLDSDGKIK